MSIKLTIHNQFLFCFNFFFFFFFFYSKAYMYFSPVFLLFWDLEAPIGGGIQNHPRFVFPPLDFEKCRFWYFLVKYIFGIPVKKKVTNMPKKGI